MGPGNSQALIVQDLHAHYGPSHVLHGVNLEFEQGTVTAVVGRNGVGKTTLINTIMGLLPGSSGHVFRNGVDLLALPTHARRRHGLALVPQGRRLFRSLSVEEHLKLVKPLREGPYDLAAILELFPRLADRLGAAASTLSGGERSMLSIARALMVNPQVLLMDEPTEGLAPMLVDSIREAIGQMHQQGLTVLLVEQKLAFALSVADRIAVMERGSILEEFEREGLQDVASLSELILRGAGVDKGASDPGHRPARQVDQNGQPEL